MLKVFVHSWDLEDHGEVLRVGQRVAWRLVFLEASDGPLREHVQEVRGTASRLAGWEGTPLPSDTDACNLSPSSGGSLYWSKPSSNAVDVEVVVVGTIRRDGPQDAPDDFPLTSGVIRRVRMETRTFVVESRRVEYGDEPPSYEDVDETYYLPWLDQGKHRAWTGVLVDLDVE
jgi:hypothetical protein